jgi:hypothetical protein
MRDYHSIRSSFEQEAAMNVLKSVPVAIWRGTRRLFSLVHGWDDVRETYGDNPNNLSDEERLTARAVASNSVNVGQSGW